MNTQELFPYLVEVLIMSGLGTAFFIIVIRKETRFHWNRAYLLLLTLVSVVLPFINWRITAPWSSGTLSEFILEPVLITGEQSSVSFTAWVVGIIWLGSGISLFLLGKRLYTLFRFKKNCKRGVIQGISCYLTGGNLGTSSFGNWLFWDETDDLTDAQLPLILNHERCHITQRHSLDLLWIDLLLVFYWWNPAFYLIRSLMVANHEALADRAVVTSENQVIYRRLLLRQWIRPQFALTHEFHLSHIKHRIDMLFTISNTPYRPWKYVLAIPLLLLGSVMVSCESDPLSEQASASSTVPALETIVPSLEEETQTDNIPKPSNLPEIKQAIGYPQIARDAGIEGSVIARILVGTSGEYVRHEVVKSDHAILTWGVENHISKLAFEPAMKDGKAITFWVNIPFNFKLLS